jgi:hypothetical protein
MTSTLRVESAKYSRLGGGFGAILVNQLPDQWA